MPVLLRAEGLTEFSVGILISVFAVMSTSIRIVFGRLMEIFDRETLLAVSMLAIIIAVGLIPLKWSTTGFAILISIFGLGPAFYVAVMVVLLTGIRMFAVKPDLIPGRRLWSRFQVSFFAFILPLTKVCYVLSILMVNCQSIL